MKKPIQCWRYIQHPRRWKLGLFLIAVQTLKISHKYLEKYGRSRKAHVTIDILLLILTWKTSSVTGSLYSGGMVLPSYSDIVIKRPPKALLLWDDGRFSVLNFKGKGKHNQEQCNISNWDPSLNCCLPFSCPITFLPESHYPDNCITISLERHKFSSECTWKYLSVHTTGESTSFHDKRQMLEVRSYNNTLFPKGEMLRTRRLRKITASPLSEILIKCSFKVVTCFLFSPEDPQLLYEWCQTPVTTSPSHLPLSRNWHHTISKNLSSTNLQKHFETRIKITFFSSTLTYVHTWQHMQVISNTATVLKISLSPLGGHYGYFKKKVLS